MRDIPIIFAAPMVRALLGGRKTQTRRLASSPFSKAQPGDRLWVREAFMLVGGGDPGVPLHRANWREQAETLRMDNIPAAEPHGWRPSIHMPRWASRLTLVIENVRVQRLQDISEADARAEGGELCPNGYWFDRSPILAGSDARGAFYLLWNSLHTKAGERWEDNPAIVALTFRVLRGAGDDR